MATEAASLMSVCRNSPSGPPRLSDTTALQHLHHCTMSAGTLSWPHLASGVLRPPTRLMPHATYLETQVPSLRTEISICQSTGWTVGQAMCWKPVSYVLLLLHVALQMQMQSEVQVASSGAALWELLRWSTRSFLSSIVV